MLLNKVLLQLQFIANFNQIFYSNEEQICKAQCCKAENWQI